jgi:CHAT domain-containing protein
VTNPAAGKVEALRQAQLAFLHGAAPALHGGAGRGDEAVEDATAAPQEAGYSHPFYWAPFVLTGNYR